MHNGAMSALATATGRLRRRTKHTFQSLSVRNYRLYFIGQGISLCGTWMQTVAQGWLVLQITGSGAQVGLVVALQFLPLLILTPLGGMVADRFPKRRVVLTTQSLFFIQQLALGIVVVSGVVQLWMVYALALAFGLVNAFDNPARQTFVSELVKREYVKNAVALNSTQVNLARAVGPTVGALLIAGVGIGFCFLANAATTVAVLIALSMIDASQLHRENSVSRLKPFMQLVEAWHYVRKHEMIREILIMATLIGTFTWEFQITLPILAKFAFGTDASAYSHLWVGMGLGSVAGGLLAAGRKKVAMHHLVGSAILFGIAMLLTAFMPTLPLAVACMVLVGFFSINFTSLANTMIQLESDSSVRGRVMSLWTMAMLGSTPIGGPIVGFIAQYAGPRWGVGIGGGAALLAGLWASRRVLSRDRLKTIPRAVRTAEFAAEAREEAKFK